MVDPAPKMLAVVLVTNATPEVGSMIYSFPSEVNPIQLSAIDCVEKSTGA